jgi:hypothetical protein
MLSDITQGAPERSHGGRHQTTDPENLVRLLTVDIRTGRIPAVAREGVPCKGVAHQRVALGDFEGVRFLPALPQATLPQATLSQATLSQVTLSQVTLSQATLLQVCRRAGKTHCCRSRAGFPCRAERPRNRRSVFSPA